MVGMIFQAPLCNACCSASALFDLFTHEVLTSLVRAHITGSSRSAVEEARRTLIYCLIKDLTCAFPKVNGKLGLV